MSLAKPAMPQSPGHAGALPDAADTAFAKVTRRIVPFIVLCYFFSYLDRVNVGFAKLQMQQRSGSATWSTASAPASSSGATCCARCRAAC
ncbi:hypothetical protein [Cupriavidus taiwanensis]|uniref:hypothetical protein n=1 Tax=Cupriavidus taiwanensis TaxID=164546 RepID=UPI001F595D76|nr:hypothetical protein [Cupriavidus taiwanensis]